MDQEGCDGWRRSHPEQPLGYLKYLSVVLTRYCQLTDASLRHPSGQRRGSGLKCIDHGSIPRGSHLAHMKTSRLVRLDSTRPTPPFLPPGRAMAKPTGADVTFRRPEASTSCSAAGTRHERQSCS